MSRMHPPSTLPNEWPCVYCSGHFPSLKRLSIASRDGKLLWNPLLQLVAAAFVERLRTDQTLEVTILVECQRAIFGTAGVVHVPSIPASIDTVTFAIARSVSGPSDRKVFKTGEEKITTGGFLFRATSRTS